MKSTLLISLMAGFAAGSAAVGLYHFHFQRQLLADFDRQVQARIEALAQEQNAARAAAVADALHKEYLLQAVRAVQGLRTPIDILLAEEARLPANLPDLGLPPQWQINASVAPVQMSRKGEFILQPLPATGIRGSVRITIADPDALGKKDGFFQGVRLECVSDIDFVAQYLPDCRYQSVMP